jgi:hypothetical protein
MPITEELKTAQELRAAGAAPPLAELLAQKLEAVAVATRESTFRDFQVELKALRAENGLQFAKLETSIAEVKASQERSLRMFMAAVLGALGVAVAIIKLFPNLH